MIAFTNLFNV